jgi:hypothetical protein
MSITSPLSSPKLSLSGIQVSSMDDYEILTKCGEGTYGYDTQINLLLQLPIPFLFSSPPPFSFPVIPHRITHNFTYPLAYIILTIFWRRCVFKAVHKKTKQMVALKKIVNVPKEDGVRLFHICYLIPLEPYLTYPP